MTIDTRELRNVLGCFATGVTVITTRDQSGEVFGITANAFTSVSLNPPLVLVCIDKNANCYFCFEQSGAFAVNILGRQQEDISRKFATKGIDKFQGIAWRPGKRGVPILEGAVAYVECQIVKSYDGGDHAIYLGEVVDAALSDGEPLLFFKGKYHSLGDPS
jgi:flavin reductase (DIM6/NTAB) family NADH-FMN oxidoreductase RutF